jgi:hypothetical protein
MKTYTYTAPSGITVHSVNPENTYSLRHRNAFLFHWTSLYFIVRKIWRGEFPTKRKG